ncbi:hypothetical protein IAT38_006334 [Cryptococcus sp. DSM 104549]
MASPTPTIDTPADEKKHSFIGTPALPVGAAGSTTPAESMVDERTSTPVGKVPKEKKISAPPKGHSGVVDIPNIARWRFFAIFGSLMLSVFLFALDQLIVAIAIAKITSEFDSLTQLPWLASGFFLTLLSFNLLYSQSMNIFPSKHVITTAVVIFEVGSLVCGVARSMDVLILGRAIAGLGAAGIFIGAMVVVAELVPLNKRGVYFAMFGVCFAIASLLGSLIGGAFADHVSWRWCFYINFPFAGIAIACLVFFQPTRAPLGRAQSYEGYNNKMLWQFFKLEWAGVVLSMAWAVSFILATQWGGVTRKWNSASVVVCLALSGVLPFVFGLYEWFAKDKAYFRIRLLKRRTIGGTCIVAFCVYGLFMVIAYYLSLAFQAVHHTSATGAGVRVLPLILVQVVTLIALSRVIPIIGRFKPVIVCGPIFISIAAGLFYSISYATLIANLYGYQVILGVGIGMCLQNIMIAVQYDLGSEPWLISLGTGLTVFVKYCCAPLALLEVAADSIEVGYAGRILALSLGGAVFENMIQRNLRSSIPGVSEQIIFAVVNDVTAVWTTVPEDLRVPVLRAYTKSLSQVFVIALPLAIIALGGAFLVRNDRMLSNEDQEKAKTEKVDAAEAEVGVDEEAAVGLGSTSGGASLGENDGGVARIVSGSRETGKRSAP